MRPGTHSWHGPAGAALGVGLWLARAVDDGEVVGVCGFMEIRVASMSGVLGEVVLLRPAPPSGDASAKRATSRSLCAKETL
jgi:hypothetical protein